MFARVTRMEGGSAESIDENIRIAKEKVLPRAREMAGWQGVVSLGDRRTGKGLLITLWESEEALHASAEQAKGLRAQAQSQGEQETSVEAYEVLMMETPAS